jgi:hypothetical protein
MTPEEPKVTEEQQASVSRASTSYVRKVRDFEALFENTKNTPPSGLVFLPQQNEFVSFTPSTGTTRGTTIRLNGEEDASQTVNLTAAFTNAFSTTFDSKFNRLLSLQGNFLFEVSASTDGSIAPQKINLISLQQKLGFLNSQGISIDPKTGILHVLNTGTQGAEIVSIQPDANGGFENSTVSRIKLPITGEGLRGIAVDPSTGQFQILNGKEKLLYEINPKGEVVARRDLSTLGLQNPQSLTFAPSGDQTDDPNEQSLYVTDNTPGGSGIVELSFIVPADLQATNTPTFVKTTNTSQFSSPSPDPSGITYLNQSNTLLISDGEVDEIPNLFQGKNLFETDLAGSLQNTYTTSAYSLEPTGVDYNPTNRFLYSSDDNSDRIFQLNPGTDGIYNTFDDFSSVLFSTRTFNSFDPESVVYSPTTGNLFIVDGVNSEVYQVTTSGTLISQFDTESLGIVDPEGGTLLDNGNLAIIGFPENRVAEVTTSGALVQVYDISAANPIKPAGLALAPSSQNASQRSLYIVDRGIDNNVDPNENDGRMFEFSLGTTATNQAPIANAGADQTIVLKANLDGSVFDDGLPAFGPLTTSWSSVSGPGTVSFANATAQDTTATFSAPGAYTLRLTANDGALSSSDDVSVQVLDPQSTLLLSSTDNNTVAGIAFQNEDILAFDRMTNMWSLYFDGSDVGLSSSVLRDFDINSDGTLLLALNSTVTLPGVGSVEPNDVVKFIPTATGNTTAGTFEFYLDGSDVGLDTSSERIDAIAIAPDGRLIVSTNGSPNVPGVTGADEDLLAFSPTSLGANTAGSWSLYFDGSDVGLDANAEDIDGVWVDSAGAIYLSTEGAYTVPGAAGTGSDLFKFTPSSLGATTAGTYSSFWTAASNGFPGLVGGVSQTF